MSVTIGADPELFVHKGNKIVSAIGMLGGSKDDPRAVNSGAVQEDNVLAEFNIAPATTADQFVSNILTVRGELDTILSEHGLASVVKSSHRYKPLELDRFGPQALEFGCDPDYNAWTQDANPSPDAASTLRTAGGHVHVGFDWTDELDKFKLAAMMDLYLGVPSVLMDDDVERRSMYGKAGACRPKSYGVEYRSLSNFWLANEELIRWVYANTMLAHENIERVYEIGDDSLLIQEAINNSDKELAQQLVNDWGIPLCV